MKLNEQLKIFLTETIFALKLTANENMLKEPYSHFPFIILTCNFITPEIMKIYFRNYGNRNNFLAFKCTKFLLRSKPVFRN